MHRAPEFERVRDESQSTLLSCGIDHVLRICRVGGDFIGYVVCQIVVILPVKFASDEHGDAVAPSLFSLMQAFQLMMVVDSDKGEPGPACGGGDLFNGSRAVGIAGVYVEIAYIFLIHSFSGMRRVQVITVTLAILTCQMKSERLFIERNRFST